MDIIKKLTCLFMVVHCIYAVPLATSHQSIVSGEGWRYSYGIVHGPEGVGHVTGESYPHGYGGFGTYAPSYGHGDYGLGHISSSHPVIHAHPELSSHPLLTAHVEIPSHHEILAAHPEVILHHEPAHHEILSHDLVSHPVLVHHEPAHEIISHHEPTHQEIISHHEPIHHEILSQHEPTHHEIIPSPPIIVGKPEHHGDIHFENDYSSLFDSFKKLYDGAYTYGIPSSHEVPYTFKGPYTFSSPHSYGGEHSYGSPYVAQGSYGHAPTSYAFSYSHRR